MTEPIDFAAAAKRRRAGAPTIKLGPDLRRVTDEASAVLADDPELFDRGGALVRVIRSDGTEKGIPAGTPRIVRVTVSTLREHLSALAVWQKHSKQASGWVPTPPPADIAMMVLDRGAWPRVRRLIGVTETPVLRPDGSITEAPGYDAATGFYFLPDVAYPPIPDRPTEQDVGAARDAVLEVVCDFPFVDPHGPSVWLALVLSLIARPAIDGCVPMFTVDANTPGTGKSKSVDAASVLVTGREAPRTTQADTDDELRKRITSVVLEGAALILVDNADRPLGGASIDAALTARVWKDRLLGRNEAPEVPVVTTWTATGNNLEIVGDTVRRTLRMRIESPTETPEDRTGWRHPLLLQWVRDERARLVSAALVILRAHALADRPLGAVKPWGSFEAWSRVVAGAVVFAGLPDPQLGRLRGEDDPKRAALAILYRGLRELAPHGLTAKEVIEQLYPPRERTERPPVDQWVELREAIETLAPPTKTPAPTPARLGYVLRKYRRRVIGGLVLDTSERAHNSVSRWVVRPSDDHGSRTYTSPEARSGGDRGDGGHVPNPSCEKPFDGYGTETSSPSPASPPGATPGEVSSSAGPTPPAGAAGFQDDPSDYPDDFVPEATPEATSPPPDNPPGEDDGSLASFVDAWAVKGEAAP